jgi:hypothetical protein
MPYCLATKKASFGNRFWTPTEIFKIPKAILLEGTTKFDALSNHLRSELEANVQKKFPCHHVFKIYFRKTKYVLYLHEESANRTVRELKLSACLLLEMLSCGHCNRWSHFLFHHPTPKSLPIIPSKPSQQPQLYQLTRSIKFKIKPKAAHACLFRFSHFDSNKLRTRIIV